MTLSPRAVEAAARALCIQSGDDPDKLTYAHAMKCTSHDRKPKYVWQYWVPFAEAALSAALAVDGLRLVPKEATLAMQNAAIPYVVRMHQTRDCYRAMIAAASDREERE